MVKISDRIAYINHDIDDAIRSGIITTEDLPKESLQVLGRTHKERIDTLVRDMIEHTSGQPQAGMSQERLQVMTDLRGFMFRNVYHNPRVRRDEDLHKIESIVGSLYEYFLEHPEELPEELLQLRQTAQTEELVKDYIAGMTDRYAIRMYEERFIPLGWK